MRAATETAMSHAAALPDFRSEGARLSAPLVGGTRRSAVTVSRFRPDAPGEVLVETSRQDAFIAIFQLSDHPPHEFRSDGASGLTPASPEGCLHIADLAGAPAAVLTEPFDSLHIHVPRAALDDLAEDLEAGQATELRTSDPWRTPDAVLRRMAPLLVSAIEREPETSQLFRDHVALACGVHLASAYGALAPRRRHVGGLAPWLVTRAKEAIAADLAGRKSLAALAAECGLSPSHFAKAFKASTGVTPHGWLQTRRVEAAGELLLTTGMPLTDVAAACGFADQSHFSRVFKRATKSSPAAWRRLSDRRSGDRRS